MQKLRTNWLEVLATCVTAVLLAFVYTVCTGFASGRLNGVQHASYVQKSDQR
jgi:hypothetical protein